MRHHVNVLALSEAISPITHMSGTEGNEAIVSREAILSGGEVHYVPVLSGNALRHKSIREPAFKYLVQQYELSGRLNVDQINFLLHGGTLTESSVTDNLNTIADLQRLFPIYRMLGGSLRNQIISGSIIVHRGVLVCRENSEILNSISQFKIDSELRSAEDFIGGYQYTRGDARKGNNVDYFEAVDELNSGDKSNLMIFGGQSILPGSLFVHGYTLKDVSIEELGAFMLSVDMWQQEGGIIGGQSSRGHGRMKTYLNINTEHDVESAIDIYKSYVTENRDEACAWLHTQFPSKKDKKEAKKKNVQTS